MNILLFDCEIAKPIPSKEDPPVDGIEYCEGWTDHLGMGISVVACYDYSWRLTGGLPRLFSKDNFEHFIVAIAEADIVAGFNSKRFDAALLSAHGVIIPETKHYDLYTEIKEAAGAGKFAKGYNLDNTCRVNLGVQKASNPYALPIEWQRGNYGKVFDYALRDIMMLKGLMDMVIAGTPLLDPGEPTRRIFVQPPAIPGG